MELLPKKPVAPKANPFGTPAIAHPGVHTHATAHGTSGAGTPHDQHAAVAHKAVQHGHPFPKHK